MRTVTMALACLAAVASSSACAQNAAVEAPINTFRVEMVEVAQMTFSLKKNAADWKIAGWTWTGPNAVPAK